MSLAKETRTQFSELETIELEDYRPLNRLGLGACVLGLASFFALFHPVIWLVPAIAVVLALFAIRQEKQADQAQAGNWLSIIGLTLALLFGSWSVTWHVSRERSLNQQAQRFALEWLTFVHDGKLQEAHQLTMAESERVRSGDSLAKFYEPRSRPSMEEMKSRGSGPAPTEMMDVMRPPASDEFKQFFDAPQVKKLLAIAKNAFFTFHENVSITTNGQHVQYVEQVFHAHYEEANQPRVLPIRIVLERSAFAGMADWRLIKLTDPNAA